MDIRITFPGAKRVDAAFDRHVVHTGGDAPSAFDVFLASLAACAGTYVLAFCDARGISTDGIALVQRAIYAADGKLPAAIELDLHLPTTFPESHRAAIVRAAESCKVKKLLANPPRVAVNAIVDAEPPLEISA